MRARCRADALVAAPPRLARPPGLPMTIGEIITTADSAGGSDVITAGAGNEALDFSAIIKTYD